MNRHDIMQQAQQLANESPFAPGDVPAGKDADAYYSRGIPVY